MSIRNLANIVTETRESLDRIPDSDAVTLDKSIVRALLDAFSALPADDVREALGLAIEEAINVGPRAGTSLAGRMADAILASPNIEVRPHGTVTEIEVDRAAYVFWDAMLRISPREAMRAALVAARGVRS